MTGSRERGVDGLNLLSVEEKRLKIRRAIYVEQVERFEEYRREVVQFLVDTNVLPDTPALFIAEERPDRVAVREFTDRQLEIARRSLGLQ